jgi:hypothetical protein
MKRIHLLLTAAWLASSLCIPVSAGNRNKAPAPVPAPADQSQSVDPALIDSMHGYVSTTDSQNEIAACIDEALSVAITRSLDAQKNSQKATKYGKAASRAWKSTKATVNYMLNDRGFLPSIEGGQLMLDENIKVHDKASADCAKQMWLDRTHDQVVADIVEMVTGLGNSDCSKRDELISDSMQSLTARDGEMTAKHILSRLTTWSQMEEARSKNYEGSFPHSIMWNVKQRQAKIDMIVNAVSKNDPITEEVKNRVHKYTKHSKAAVRTSQVVSTTLNAASLTPTLIGPAAQGAMLLFSLGTGGFEEDKLITEMYLGKRYQSRQNSFHNQALMALDAYELGVQSRNIPLTSCSALLLRRLGGEDLFVAVTQPSRKLQIAHCDPAANEASVSSIPELRPEHK